MTRERSTIFKSFGLNDQIMYLKLYSNSKLVSFNNMLFTRDKMTYYVKKLKWQV